MSKLISIILLLGLTNLTFGQKINIPERVDTAKIYKVELRDGTVMIVNILQLDSSFIVMRSSSIPKIEIPLKNVLSIDEIDPINYKNNTYWFPNPNATRYFFSPSAFKLGKNKGYYQNTYLLLNSFNIGITKNISVGGGFELLSLFSSHNDGFKTIVILTPKAGFKITKLFHAGTGVLYVRTPSSDPNNAHSGILYGIGTYGNLDYNLTCGVGWGYLTGDFINDPVITISGMARMTKKSALVFENWFIPLNGHYEIDGYYNVYSYGIRFFGEKIAVDLAFLNNSKIFKDIFIGIPYLDFVVSF